MIPLRIEANNFRGIPHAEADLSNIDVAAVCGPNGAGKSTFFTTAPMFALFGWTPKGIDLGKMVRTGQTEMSTTFDFEHRGETYRVTRSYSRKGRGKSTLELQKQIGGKWESESGASIGETEEKIRTLLNLDANTFINSSMILQGAANKFTAALPSERKEILKKVIGLDIYDRLLEVAKTKAKSTELELEKVKAKQAELDEKLKDRQELEAERDTVETQLKQVADDISQKEAELRETEETVRSLQADTEKAEEILKQIDALAIEISDKQTERDTQQKRLAEAEKYTSQEEKIKRNAAEYERVNGLVITLCAKRPQLDSLKADVGRIESDITKVDASIKKIDTEIADKEQALRERPELERADKEYREAVTSTESMDVLFEKWTMLDKEVSKARETWNTELTAYNSKTKNLERELETLRGKVKMLDDSNCIDSERASCRFLADAIEAKARLIEVQNEYNGHIIQACKNTALAQKMSGLENDRDSLGYDPVEHKRLKSLVTDLRPKTDKLARLSGLSEVLEQLQAQKQQEENRKAELAAQLDAKKADVQELEKELAPLADHEKRLPNLQTWADALKRLPAEQEVKTAATERIAALDREIATKQEQSGKLGLERDVLLAKTNNLNIAKLNVTSYQGYIKAKQDEQNTLHTQAGGIKAKLEDMAKAEEERRQVAAKIEPTAKELTRWQTLIKAFGRDGIPALIIENAVPELEQIATGILGQMTNGQQALRFETQKEIKSKPGMTETLDIWVECDEPEDRIYESFSGGEQLRIDFAVRFALSELLANRAGGKIEWLTVDEGLGSQDAEHRELVLEAIKKVSDRFRKTLVITHIEAAQAVFEQQIYLDKKDGQLEIKVA
ncbi:MAG: Nuclease SbcCD subunit C [Pelotomaculum sp. PtaU1.Bin065]|nr:MAG: Nuclease SbcCD subunit C [Pelotomaculum sp. PtaU1.Bin065]